MPFQKNQFNILNIYQFDLIKKHQIINNCVQFNVGHNVHLYTCLKSWLDKRVKHMVRHLKYMIDMDIMIVIETWGLLKDRHSGDWVWWIIHEQVNTALNMSWLEWIVCSFSSMEVVYRQTGCCNHRWIDELPIVAYQ